jgi:hypothetical protein
VNQNAERQICAENDDTKAETLSGKNENIRQWQNESCTAAELKTTHAATGITEASAPLLGGNENPGDVENEI